MKKFFSMVLALSIIVSLLSISVYALQGGNGQGKNNNKTIQGDATTETTTNENLKTKPGKDLADKEARKEYIKQVVAEKRAQNDHSIPVFVNGKEVKFDVPPVIKYGRTLIPVRAVTNALGADVQWDSTTNTVTITKDDTIIVITLGSNIATVNGTEVKLDASAELVSNRTMVPIRFIAETFKQTVEWDDETGSVIIDEDDDTTETDTDTEPTTTTDGDKVTTETTTTETTITETTTTETTTTETTTTETTTTETTTTETTAAETTT